MNGNMFQSNQIDKESKGSFKRNNIKCFWNEHKVNANNRF